MRVGIFGGTFDPVHVGHLVAAVNARHALDLDEVLLVVANEPWQKVGDREVNPALDRLALVEAALGDVRGIEASGIEIERGGPSYTADTVATLRERYDVFEPFLIVGADVVNGLSTWERHESLKEEATLVIVTRPGALLEDIKPEALSGWQYSVVEIPALEISSTDLRERAATGRPLDFLIPEPAIRLIRDRGLYAPLR